MHAATIIVIAVGLLALSVASGMLGLGVAFAAVPFLGFFMGDLVHEVQPVSLFLNGVAAIFAAVGFAKSDLVAWRPALMLTGVTEDIPATRKPVPPAAANGPWSPNQAKTSPRESLRPWLRRP